MKIVSCFTDLKELEPLAEAGADEFYTAVGELPAFGSKNLPSTDLAAAIIKTKALGKKISLAVNDLHATATDKQLGAITGRIRDLDKLGVDAFIFSNPYLLELFSGGRKRLRAELHLSSVQPVFNSLSAAFFQRFNISRIILPNQISSHEARKILYFCRTRSIETEIFDYRFFGCAYVNGRCQLHHPIHFTLKSAMLNDSLCHINAKPGGLIKLRNLDIPNRAGELPGIINRIENRFTRRGSPRLSNAATFFDFFASGVQYLKYGTRSDRQEVKVKKVGELRAMIGLAEKLSSSRPRTKASQAFILELAHWNKDGF
ncbi:MAG: hypothetical protein A2270_09480 [Elusimicrobia bacterium RIFOXYA12_FULL_51_18]|nr:MAG: hypothetical protein A2270_09480 [Elusimicrobia bacterium RIFOXYA12_FULL_51_18]OGS32732.1 MAG: hypothetical protein A2218_11795 [Elusimicrobia bacterium RIFOXYA2_FULL_53_38]